MQRYFYSLLTMVLPLSFLLSQGTIKGVVTDQNNEPVISATVAVNGTSKGTITDLNGYYEIKNLAAGEYEVEASFVGYTTSRETVTIGENETIEVDMQIREDIKLLNEIVVIGYGVQKRKDVLGTLEQVKGDKLIETSTPSFEAALQGQAAGVNVLQGSGMSGASSVIRIRGISSISAVGDPLYVIDGIPLENNNFLAEANWQNGAFNNNPLAVLNGMEIESIEILKDASAAGIYGTRGSNGVILITTKRGHSKKPTFNLNIGYGTSDPIAKPDFLSGQEWLQLRQEAWENDGNTGAVWIPNYSTAQDEPETRAAAYQRASQYNTDWWDLLTRTGFKQSYSLSSQFGIGNAVRAYASLSYSDDQSYLVGNSFTKYNARLNLDAHLTKHLKLIFSGSYNRGFNERVRVAYTGGHGDAMSVALPIYPVYDSTNASGYWRGFNTSGAPNPLFTNENFKGFTVDDRVISSAQLVYSPIDRFTITASAGYDYLKQNNDFYESALLRQQPAGVVSRDLREINNFTSYLTGEYKIMENAVHDLNLMAGTEYQQSNTSGINNLLFEDSTFTTIDDFSIDKNGNYNYNEQNSTRISNEVNKFISFFGRANYKLYDRYLIQATARIDGTSKFLGSKRRYSFVPTIAAGWIISEEAFFNSKAVNFLKFKIGYGEFGNSNIPQNRFLALYGTNGQYNGERIIYPLIFSNSELAWETTSSFDVGLISGFWDDMFQLEVNYYRKHTRDVLLGLTLPNYTAPGGQYFDNVGEILNEGVEVDITANVFRNKNFTWTINANGAYNYNEILDIGVYTEDAVSGGTNDTRVVVGYPVGTNYLIPFEGVDPENGRPIYLNQDGTQTYVYDEQADRRPVGDVLPDLVGGITNSFRWKNIDLSFLFVYSIGGDIYDSSSKRQFTFLTDWNVDRRALDRWTPETPNAANPIPTLDPAAWGNDKEWFNTSQWIHDASYVRLRNVNLGYHIPEKWTGGLKARMILSATNLLTFTNFSGLDPEVVRDFDNVTDRNLSPNISYLTPPQERAFNLRLNVNF